MDIKARDRMDRIECGRNRPARGQGLGQGLG